MLRLADHRGVARELLRRAVRATGSQGVRVRPQEAAAAESLADSGVIRLQEKVVGTAAEPRWVPWRATVPDDMTADVREWLGIADPATERAALLADVGLPSTPALAREAEWLAAADPAAPLRPPDESALAGCAWSVYAAGLRAAAVWARSIDAGQRPSARELAAQALGWSKAWTPARRDALSHLVGEPFDQAVATSERFIRLRGPVTWRLGGHGGDARSATPWLGLPESAVDHIRVDASGAAGTLVVENLETFEEVCRHSRVPSGWVCLFGGGYASTALVALLGMLPDPVGAWGDIDPHGLRIIADLSRRSSRPVRPVAMPVDVLHGPHAVAASDEQRADAQRLAGDLDGPLRDLAAAIVATGRVVEQEAVHTEMLGRLAHNLAASAPLGGAAPDA